MVPYNEITLWFHARLRATVWKCLIICHFEDNIKVPKWNNWRIHEVCFVPLTATLYIISTSYILIFLCTLSIVECLSVYFKARFKNPSKISGYLAGVWIEQSLATQPVPTPLCLLSRQIYLISVNSLWWHLLTPSRCQ